MENYKQIWKHLKYTIQDIVESIQNISENYIQTSDLATERDLDTGDIIFTDDAQAEFEQRQKEEFFNNFEEHFIYANDLEGVLDEDCWDALKSEIKEQIDLIM